MVFVWLCFFFVTVCYLLLCESSISQRLKTLKNETVICLLCLFLLLFVCFFIFCFNGVCARAVVCAPKTNRQAAAEGFFAFLHFAFCFLLFAFCLLPFAQSSIFPRKSKLSKKNSCTQAQNISLHELIYERSRFRMIGLKFE